MELLDVVDEWGNPTGESIEREIAHAKGIRHKTAHVWLVRNIDKCPEVLLQKRSDIKDSHPGCYDISSAGHIPAGMDDLTSALRELWEELGVKAKKEDLIYCGKCSDRYEKIFHGTLFIDNQVSSIYLLICPAKWDENYFTLQEEEVSEVTWLDLEKCVKAVRENEISHCIRVNELEMVKEAVRRLAGDCKF